LYNLGEKRGKVGRGQKGCSSTGQGRKVHPLVSIQPKKREWEGDLGEGGGGVWGEKKNASAFSPAASRRREIWMKRGTEEVQYREPKVIETRGVISTNKKGGKKVKITFGEQYRLPTKSGGSGHISESTGGRQEKKTEKAHLQSRRG